MNALQRDLKKLVPLLESLGAAVLSTRYYPAGALTLRTANLDAVVYPLNL